MGDCHGNRAAQACWPEPQCLRRALLLLSGGCVPAADGAAAVEDARLLAGSAAGGGRHPAPSAAACRQLSRSWSGPPAGRTPTKYVCNRWTTTLLSLACVTCRCQTACALCCWLDLKIVQHSCLSLIHRSVGKQPSTWQHAVKLWLWPLVVLQLEMSGCPCPTLSQLQMPGSPCSSLSHWPCIAG